MKFSKRLKIELKEQGRTQKSIADSLGISKQTVNGWLKGIACPNLETFYKLCIILQVSSDYLLGLEE